MNNLGDEYTKTDSWVVKAPFSRRQKLELIDWSERYPQESSLQIAVRQSTVCTCGKNKEIGQATCGH